ncbi:recQ-mediated genome instability protein 2 [Ornithorhynchus anatinus]|uniref:RecQ mediated genome instability 2 n=1 Tax=Ornithorhynchus anatinus TaxID=9258 RepID=A0A6I8N219_ORNAN|nr:recQ-mediated genome instability protein 2 [Ornithorhynchus anatinus]
MAGASWGAAAPPRKVMAAQLRREQEASSSSSSSSWSSSWRPGRPPAVVWMQGTVLAVDEAAGRARLTDPTGPFTASGLHRLPRGKARPAAGMYVMIMGVVESFCPEPCLQAVKMTDLSGNPLHKSMWGLEVEDLHSAIP